MGSFAYPHCSSGSTAFVAAHRRCGNLDMVRCPPMSRIEFGPLSPLAPKKELRSPVVLKKPAPRPKKESLDPVVLVWPAPLPKKELPPPDVLFSPALNPKSAFCLHRESSSLPPNNNGELEGVKYERLSVVFINAFKEQQAQIQTQQQQIKKLGRLFDSQERTLKQYRKQLSALQSEIEGLKRLVSFHKTQKQD